MAFAGRRSSVAADRRSSVAAVDRRTSVFASESPAFELPPPSYDAPAAVPLAEMTVDQVSRAGKWGQAKDCWTRAQESTDE